jgi:hypothetical protein
MIVNEISLGIENRMTKKPGNYDLILVSLLLGEKLLRKEEFLSEEDSMDML